MKDIICFERQRNELALVLHDQSLNQGAIFYHQGEIMKLSSIPIWLIVTVGFSLVMVWEFLLEDWFFSSISNTNSPEAIKENWEWICIVVIFSVLTYFLSVTNRKRNQREESLNKALREKDILLKEVNHRAKNNMQLISSLLSLQSRDRPDKSFTDKCNECNQQIQAMALVHDQIIDSSHVGEMLLEEYVHSLIGCLAESLGIDQTRIKIKVDVQSIKLDINSGIYIGLILNELLTNSIKYAFPDEREGEISIDGHLVEGGKLELTVKDNGIGLSKNFDLTTADSLGLRLVQLLVEDQLNGTLELKLSEETQFKMVFPKKLLIKS